MTSLSVPMARSVSSPLVLAHGVLLTCYLIFSFVGTSPFGSFGTLADRLAGDSVNRTIVIAMLMLALPILWHCREDAAACVRGNRLLVAVLAICVASVLWSEFPGLTIRRALLFILLTISAVAIAAGPIGIRGIHRVLFIVLTGIVVVNLLAAAVWPAVAFDDIGLKGMHIQKNVAGNVAMIAVVVAVTWAWGARTGLARFIGLVAIAMSVLFLVLTRSKTSIGLTAMGLAAGFVVLLVLRLRERAALGIMAIGLAGLAGVLGLLAVLDFNAVEALETIGGDATVTGRDELWAFAWKSANLRPWLGYGYGAFWDVGEAFDPLVKLEPGTWLGDVEKGIINQAHNGYLELWLHIGWPATVLAVISVVLAIKTAGRRATHAVPETGSGPAFAAAGLLLLMYLFHNLTEATLFIRGTPFCNIATLLMLLAARPELSAPLASIPRPS